MSDFVSNFHLLRPLWLLMLIPVAGIAFYLVKQQSQASSWQNLIAPHLFPYLVDGKSVSRNKFPIYVLLALWLAATLAAAGPAWLKRPQPVVKQASALVIAWDLSPSMAAQDVKPSRLVRARLKLIDLLKQRKEGLTALIAYSGEAHVVTPLTDDTDTIISLLHGLEPSIMPAIGSNAEMALELSNNLLAEGAAGTGNILFLTDGIDAAAHEAFAQIHDTSPHNITFWGIGTSEGAPIPLSSGGFAYDRNRNMVIARLNEAELTDLAVKVGGLYIPFSNNDFDIDTIKNVSFDNSNQATQEVDRSFDQWYEHGPYLLLLLLPIAALAFRRGLLLCIPLMFFISPESRALEWQDLWKNRDQKAQEMLQDDPAGAAQTFKNKDWQAIAEYKAGNFEEALKGFEGGTANDFYNRGNALTHLGEYDAAIEQFRQALELDPQFAEANNNLAIAEQLQQMKQQQQQQESESEQGEKGEQQNPDQQNQNGQQQESDSEDSQQQSQSDQQDQQGKQNQQQNNQNESTEESQSPGEQQDSDLTEQQQQALQDAYGENDESQKPEEQASKPEPNDLEKQDSQAQQQFAQQPSQEEAREASEEQSETLLQQTLSPEEQEQQQALEQWLRKVPDDPSGLMRNKFNYEYRARKREMRSNGFRQPDGGEEEERW